MKPGLYEQLLTIALQSDLESLVDPRLNAVAPVSADEAHAILAQFLEHLLLSGLATFRRADSASKQQRFVERVFATLAEELGVDWSHRLYRHTAAENFGSPCPAAGLSSGSTRYAACSIRSADWHATRTEPWHSTAEGDRHR